MKTENELHGHVRLRTGNYDRVSQLVGCRYIYIYIYIYINQFKNQRLRNFDHQFIKRLKHTKINAFTEFYLKPLAQKLPAFIKDTTHLINEIDKLNKKGPLPPGTLLVSWDVV